MKQLMNKLLITTGLLLVAPLSMAEYPSTITGYSIEDNDVKLSPDGQNLAMAINNDGHRVLYLLNTDTREAVSGINLGKEQDVGNFLWASNDRLVLEVLHREAWDKTPKFYGELYAVDSDGSDRELLYGFRVEEQQVGSLVKSRKAAYAWARVVSMLPEEDNKILISSANLPGGKMYFEDPLKRKHLREMDINELYSTVHELNLYTGKLSSKRTQSPTPNNHYVTNENGEFKFAYGAKPGEQIELFKYDDPEWVKLEMGQSNDFMPMTFASDFSSMSYIDTVGDNVKCLYRYSFITQKTEQLSSVCDLEPRDVLLTQDKTNVYGVEKPAEGVASPSYDIFDTSTVEGDFFSQVAGLFEGFNIRVNSRSDNGHYWVIKAVDNAGSNKFYLYSREQNEFTQIL